MAAALSPRGGCDIIAESPKMSLTAARDAARRLSTKEDIVICVVGTHIIPHGQPLELNASDNHEVGVTWRGAPGATFSGGVQLTGWTPTTLAGGPAYVAPLPAAYPSLMPVRALWVRGARASRTSLSPKALGSFTRWTSADNASVGFTVSGDIPPSWSNSTGAIEFSWAIVIANWIQPRCTVASVDFASRNITLSEPCGAMANEREARRKVFLPPPVNIEAAMGALSPGVFWHDVENARVYYALAPGQTLADIEADAWVPAADVILQLNETSGHTFSGLTFKHAGWSQVNSPSGFVDAQSAVYGNGKEPPGAVRAAGVKNVLFDNCSFQAIASPYALEIANKSADSGVVRSSFTDLSGGAVKLGGIDAGNNAFSSNASDWDARLLVTDSLIANSSLEYQGAAAIFAGYVQSATLSHNFIVDVSYSAISVGWGWGNAAPAGFGNNTVAFNHIARVMKRLRDGGGIYVNGAEDGSHEIEGWVSRISDNYVEEDMAVFAVYYLDNGASNWLVERNVAANSSLAWCFYMQGPPNSVPPAYNSTVSDFWYSDALDPKINCVADGCKTSNINRVTGDWPPAAAAIIAGAGPRSPAKVN
jgi:hypothetical protein